MCNNKKLLAKFELFYQNLIKDIAALHDDIIMKIKTKFSHTCDKYSYITVACKYHMIVKNLRNNKELVILKQDKGRRVAQLDRSKYTEKFFSIRNSK